ncbi:aldo/keto reductase, partial [Planktotalea sp.]|uniref:aldo/keto reductase n=1 Tax=Planktotalea sp. TaxID=2029877 RepID=UPI003296B96D
AYVHDIGTYTHGDDDAKHRADFFDSGYDALVELKRAGRIGAFGLGVNEIEVCLDVMDHGPIDVILLAGRLSLLERRAEEVLVPRCRDAGTSLVLGGIFNSGILATGVTATSTYDYGPAPEAIKAQVNALAAKAEGLGISLAQAALQFAVSHPAAASVLIGTAKRASFERNIELAKQDPLEGFSDIFG